MKEVTLDPIIEEWLRDNQVVKEERTGQPEELGNYMKLWKSMGFEGSCTSGHALQCGGWSTQTVLLGGGDLWSGMYHIGVCASMLSRFSRVQLFVTLWTVAHQASLSVGFSRQEYWSRLPCFPPGDLPSVSPLAPVLQADSWPLSHQGSPCNVIKSLSLIFCSLVAQGRLRRRGFDPWVGKILWRRVW